MTTHIKKQIQQEIYKEINTETDKERNNEINSDKQEIKYGINTKIKKYRIKESKHETHKEINT